MKIFRSLVQSTAARLGYTIIPNWRMLTFPQSTYLRRLFDYCGIEIVIDGGANEGQYRNFLRHEVGFEGDIVSVEPIPAMIEKLRERAAGDRHWRIEGFALAQYVGTATLNIMASDRFSSLRAPEDKEIDLFAKHNAVVEQVAVRTTTLDELVSRIPGGGRRNIYLKLDTQGSDLEALQGASCALARVAALQTEASFKRIYHGAPKYSAVVDFLNERGFELSAVHPNNAGHFPVLVELDFHFISRDLVPATYGVHGAGTG